MSAIRMTFFSGMKWTPSGCCNFASNETPSLSPKLWRFLGLMSPPITLRAEVKVFMLIDLTDDDSESATYSSMWFYEIKPIVSPLGCAHSHCLMSVLWLRLPSLPLPEKLKARFVLRFKAHIWWVPAIAKTRVSLLTATMSHGDDNR